LTIELPRQNDAWQFIGPMGSKERFKSYAALKDLPVDKGDWQMEMPDYLDACQSLDANLRRVRKELEKLGIADNTLVI
jgi:arylsulfatase A-like enzyme